MSLKSIHQDSFFMALDSILWTLGSEIQVISKNDLCVQLSGTHLAFLQEKFGGTKDSHFELLWPFLLQSDDIFI